MINLETFKKVINHLKYYNDFINDVNTLIYNSGVMSDTSIFGSVLESDIIDLLYESFGIPLEDDIILWWCYEADFGRKFERGDIVISGLPDVHIFKSPDLSSTEKLYEYLKWYSENCRTEANNE